MSVRNQLTLLLVLGAPLVVTGCRDRSDHREGSEYSKTGEPADDEFAHERAELSARTREQLARVDQRIRELGDRGSEKARQAADELHAERDRLAPKVDELGRHAKDGWDRFKTEVADGLDELQRKLDAAVTD